MDTSSTRASTSPSLSVSMFGTPTKQTPVRSDDPNVKSDGTEKTNLGISPIPGENLDGTPVRVSDSASRGNGNRTVDMSPGPDLNDSVSSNGRAASPLQKGGLLAARMALLEAQEDRRASTKSNSHNTRAKNAAATVSDATDSETGSPVSDLPVSGSPVVAQHGRTSLGGGVGARFDRLAAKLDGALRD
jgi:hypothetical protein